MASEHSQVLSQALESAAKIEVFLCFQADEEFVTKQAGSGATPSLSDTEISPPPDWDPSSDYRRRSTRTHSDGQKKLDAGALKAVRQYNEAYFNPLRSRARLIHLDPKHRIPDNSQARRLLVGGKTTPVSFGIYRASQDWPVNKTWPIEVNLSRVFNRAIWENPHEFEGVLEDWANKMCQKEVMFETLASTGRRRMFFFKHPALRMESDPAYEPPVRDYAFRATHDPIKHPDCPIPADPWVRQMFWLVHELRVNSTNRDALHWDGTAASVTLNREFASASELGATFRPRSEGESEILEVTVAGRAHFLFEMALRPFLDGASEGDVDPGERDLTLVNVCSRDSRCKLEYFHSTFPAAPDSRCLCGRRHPEHESWSGDDDLIPSLRADAEFWIRGQYAPGMVRGSPQHPRTLVSPHFYFTAQDRTRTWSQAEHEQAVEETKARWKSMLLDSLAAT